MYEYLLVHNLAGDDIHTGQSQYVFTIEIYIFKYLNQQIP